jgi:pyridoxal 5'-phosphate synthase pdxT subunit
VKFGVLAVQGAFGAHIAILEHLGVPAVEVRRPTDLDGLDALVMPGGESTAMSRLLETSGLAEPLSQRLSAGLPVLGTCAGMILLSREVLDGRADQRCFGAIDLAVRRNGYGRQLASFETDVAVRELGAPFPAVFIRAPVVEELGPGVEVLAEVDGLAVVCRQGPVWVTSFHPELGNDHRLHELFLSRVAGP